MQRIIAIWAGLLALVIVTTSVFGAAHFFSPIPWEDQWDGYVGFFRSLDNGVWLAWWTPHMEHRIVFSRVLFWLDAHVFGGWNAFTLVSNFLLMAALCGTLIVEARKNGLSKPDLVAAGLLIVGFMFSWIQYANFLSGFQSQFIAVYLFAFLGFAQYSWERLGLAVMWCILSALCMANGLVALVVVAIQGVLLRRPVKQIAVMLAAAVVTGWVYLHGQVMPVLPIPEAMQHARFIKAKFFLAFLGNPAYYFTGSNGVAMALGALLFAFAAVLVVWLYMKREITPYRSFLIAAYGFVIASGLGATRGRWMIGFDGATASRYTTPTLLAIVILLLLALDVFTGRRKIALGIAAALLTLLVPLQQYITGNGVGMPHFDHDDMYGWKLAVLGIKTDMDHPGYDKLIYPPVARANLIEQATYAAQKNLGPYKTGWLHDAGIVKYDPSLRDDARCVGFLDGTGTDEIGRTARGWAIATQFAQPETLVVLVDEGNQTVGYGVTGMSRPDVKDKPDAGWIGFAKQGNGPMQAYAYVGGKYCHLRTGN